MRLFSGTSNRPLAEGIAKYTGQELGAVDIERFPDGEIFVKLRENIRGKDVYVIQSVCQQPNEYLMELLIMIDAMRRSSAARITAVLPFYGYARQDRKDQPRVPITAKLVANLLVAAGCNRLLTVDLHAQQIQGFFDIPVDHLYAAPVIVKYMQDKQVENPIVVSPDIGGVKAAYAYSQMLECGLAVVAKQRKGPTEVDALALVGDVEGKSAIMVDDLTTTAGTLCSAATLLKEHGAGKIFAAVTHGTITEMGIERLQASDINELVCTDTVPVAIKPDYPITVLSVAELLGEAILRIHDNQSVTSLFKVKRDRGNTMSTAPTEILAVEPRTDFGTGPMRRLRRAGTVPGNLVNPKGDNVSIQMDGHTFDLIMLHHASEHLVMDVTLNGEKKKVLVREVQRHPLTEAVLHVDFLEVAMDEKMKVLCMIETVNDAVGVTQNGGILEMLVREIEVECLPGDLVETIEVDISQLDVGQSIHVSDLALPSGLASLTAGDVAVVTVMAPRLADEGEEEGEGVEGEEGAGEPEVIGKSKEDESEG